MRRLAVALGLLFAGCGGTETVSRPPEPVTVTVTVPAGVELPVGACTVFERGSDVRVRFRGPGGDAACNRFIRERSGGGQFWSRETREYDPNAYEVYLICALFRRGLEMTVVDSGSARNGKAICGDFVHAGWKER